MSDEPIGDRPGEITAEHVEQAYRNLRRRDGLDAVRPLRYMRVGALFMLTGSVVAVALVMLGVEQAAGSALAFGLIAWAWSVVALFIEYRDAWNLRRVGNRGDE